MTQSKTQYDWDTPDAWIEIPEFGVKPSEVNEMGFAYFVADPEQPVSSAFDMIYLIRAARKLAQVEFKTLKEMHAVQEDSVFNLGLCIAEYGNDKGQARWRETLNDRQRVAFVYSAIMRGLRARYDPKMKQEAVVQALARAAHSLLAWTTEGPKAALAAQSIDQSKRRKGKTKLTESQKKQVIREYEAAEVTYGMIKSLARKFDVSVRTISALVNP